MTSWTYTVPGTAPVELLFLLLSCLANRLVCGYMAVLDKQDAPKGLTFEMEGFKSFTFPLTANKDVYTYVSSR